MNTFLFWLVSKIQNGLKPPSKKWHFIILRLSFYLEGIRRRMIKDKLQ